MIATILAIAEFLIIIALVVILLRPKKKAPSRPEPPSPLRFISKLIGTSASHDYLGEMVKAVYLAQTRRGQPSQEYLIRLLEGFLHHVEFSFRLSPVVPPRPTSSRGVSAKYDAALHTAIGDPRPGEEVEILEFGWQIVLPNEVNPTVVKKAIVRPEEHDR